jgi:hypothetical protein
MSEAIDDEYEGFSDEELTLAAEELFLELDEREAGDDRG